MLRRNEADPSTIQSRRLNRMVPPTIPKKRQMHTLNRSWGNRPAVNAQDAMPSVALLGSVYNEFGASALTKSGEFWSFNCSAKLDGGLYVGVVMGSQ